MSNLKNFWLKIFKAFGETKVSVCTESNPAFKTRYNPNYKPTQPHRVLRDFLIKGKKVQAYSRKDAIKRLKHRRAL